MARSRSARAAKRCSVNGSTSASDKVAASKRKGLHRRRTGGERGRRHRRFGRPLRPTWGWQAAGALYAGRRELGATIGQVLCYGRLRLATSVARALGGPSLLKPQRLSATLNSRITDAPEFSQRRTHALRACWFSQTSHLSDPYLTTHIHLAESPPTQRPRLRAT